MGSHTLTMDLLLTLLMFSFLTFHEAVNTGRNIGQIRGEIAYGDVVDYSSMKRNYPFMARLIMDDLRCGGALIADRFIATARHCLEVCPCYSTLNPSNDWKRCENPCFVKLRENSDFEQDEETIHAIKTAHVPMKNNIINTATDFALIELTSSANTCNQRETENGKCWQIQPVKLTPPAQPISLKHTVTTLGWGATEWGEQSEFLHRLDITVNSSSHRYQIETNVGPNGADPCSGDSGGPLLLRGDDYKWILIGTLEGDGFDCNKPFDRSDNTSTWSRVDVLLPWIQSILRGNMITETSTISTSPATTKRTI